MQLGALLWGVCLATALGNPALAESRCAFPLVSKKSVALGIFNVIANGVETREKRSKYVTEIHDDRGKWTVFESLKGTGDFVREFMSPNGQRMETVQVTLGGGGLGMSIDKCTAVISDAGLQR